MEGDTPKSKQSTAAGRGRHNYKRRIAQQCSQQYRRQSHRSREWLHIGPGVVVWEALGQERLVPRMLERATPSSLLLFPAGLCYHLTSTDWGHAGHISRSLVVQHPSLSALISGLRLSVERLFPRQNGLSLWLVCHPRRTAFPHHQDIRVCPATPVQSSTALNLSPMPSLPLSPALLPALIPCRTRWRCALRAQAARPSWATAVRGWPAPPW